MKIVNKQKLKGEGTGTLTMPNELRIKLKDLSINEAIAHGLITDLGDEDGTFLFPHAVDDRVYAIVNGFTIPVSKSVADKSGDDLLEILGDLRFRSEVSNIPGDGFGKEWYRLSMPAYVNLGAEGKVNIAEQMTRTV